MSQLEEVAAFAGVRTTESTSAFGDLDVTVTVRRGFASLFDLGVLSIVLLSLLRRYGIVTQTFIVHVPFYGRVGWLPKYWVFSLFYLKPAALLLFVAICISYFTVFEAAFGWTPGKLLFGIRVVDFYGGTPTVGQALMRNAFRLLDAYPFVVPNLVGVAILLSNRRRQRGGDKAAGTLVVHRQAHSAIRTVRGWQRQKAMADLSRPDEVWN